MKYEKGTFTVIPNKEYLKGKPSELQSIYFWLCDHADENGVCYPTRRTLAREAGCGIRTLDKYINELESMGLIEKTMRQKPKSNENSSNLYQLMVVSKKTPPSAKKNTTPSVKKNTETIPSINSTHLTQIVASDQSEVLDTKQPFSYEDKLNWLSNSYRKDFKIIALYWSIKSFRFDNEAQFQTALKRELRPASQLKGYDGKELREVMEYCDKNFELWSLETVVKRVSDIINRN